MRSNSLSISDSKLKEKHIYYLSRGRMPPRNEFTEGEMEVCLDNFDMFVWQWKFVLKGWLSQLGSPNQQPGLTWHIVTYIKIAVNHPFNDGEWRWSGIYVQSSPLIVIFCIMYVFPEICSLMQMITQKLVRFLFSNIINFKITFDFQIYFHSFHWPHYKPFKKTYFIGKVKKSSVQIERT